MNAILGSLLMLASAAMIMISFRAAFVPVSRPIWRVYRASSPVYFWTLIGGYALVGTFGLFILVR